MQNSQVNDASITELIGMHGHLLEEACAEVFKSSDKIMLETNRYPILDHKGEETEIDIVARYFNHMGLGCFLLIECKREDPNSKRWIFMEPDNNSRKDSGILGLSKKDNAPNGDWSKFRPDLTIGPSMGRYGACFSLRRKTKKEPGADGFTIDKEPIYYACRQLMRGYCGFIKEAMDKFNINKKGHHAVNRYAYIPIIITTANLSVFEYDKKEIDLASGRLRKPGISKEVHWLLYSWSSDLISDFDTTSREDDELWPKELKYWKEWSIIIVNANHLNEFIDGFYVR